MILSAVTAAYCTPIISITGCADDDSIIRQSAAMKMMTMMMMTIAAVNNINTGEK